MSLTAEPPATVPTVPTVPIVERRPIRLWSPAQLIALVLGVAAIVFGVIALARTGVDFSHLTQSHEMALGFGHTPLLGLAEVGFGFLLVLAALFPIVGRNLMTLIGAAALGLGIVVVGGWWSTRMLTWLGADDKDGWLFVAVGGFVLLTSFFTPVFTWGGPRVVRRPAASDPTPEPLTESDHGAEPTEPALPAPTLRERLHLPPRTAGQDDSDEPEGSAHHDDAGEPARADATSV